MRVSVRDLYIAYFTLIVLAVPVNIGNYRFLNELILPLCLLATVPFVMRQKIVSKEIAGVLICGASFLTAFLLIFLIYMPDVILVKDVVEVCKPLIYAVIFSAGFSLGVRVNEDRLISYCLALSLVSVVFSGFVYFPFLHGFVDLYKGRMSTEAFNLHFWRFSGTLAFPGPFGYWLVLSSLLALLACRRGLIKFWQAAAIYSFFLMAIILTGSRGAFVVYVVTTAAWLAFGLGRRGWVWASGLVLILAVPFFFALDLFVNQGGNGSEVPAVMYLLDGFSNVEGSTFGHRIRELEMLWGSLSDGYFLGHGPNNDFLRKSYGPVESVYFFYGFKFGIPGLLFYGWVVALVFTVFYRLYKARSRSTVPYIFSIWALVCLTLGALNESITEEYKSFYMFFLLFGVIVSMHSRDIRTWRPSSIGNLEGKLSSPAFAVFARP